MVSLRQLRFRTIFPTDWTIQTPLTIKRFSHRLCSSKIWTCRNRFSQKIAVAAQSQFILRGAFFRNSPQIQVKSHFATDTNYVLGLIEWFIEQRQCDLPEEGVKVPPIRKHKLAPKE